MEVAERESGLGVVVRRALVLQHRSAGPGVDDRDHDRAVHGARRDEDPGRQGARGHADLHAVETPTVAVRLGAGHRFERILTGFDERRRQDGLARDDARQDLRSLGLGAEARDRQGAEHDGRVVKGPARRSGRSAPGRRRPRGTRTRRRRGPPGARCRARPRAASVCQRSQSLLPAPASTSAEAFLGDLALQDVADELLQVLLVFPQPEVHASLPVCTDRSDPARLIRPPDPTA